jgi:A/G-specific adenine glycosylase
LLEGLLAWYATNGRSELPWRKTVDPYRILVSELMLQQTQVPRVVPKYDAFLRKFPTMRALAQADRASVLVLWQGLGYNNRAVRLHALARALTEQQAPLPADEQALRRLPGIGPYTAGAIMAFAHDVPATSVDVNVARVLKRALWRPDAAVTRSQLDAAALSLCTASGSPRQWQSALMDFGSAVCTAKAPRCSECPIRTVCASRGPRPEELQESIAKRQSPFIGSVRWWRGRILKQLLDAPVKEAHLLHCIVVRPSAEEQDRYDAALAALKREGVVRETSGILRIV